MKPSKAQMALLEKAYRNDKVAPEGSEHVTARKLVSIGLLQPLEGRFHVYGWVSITEAGRSAFEEHCDGLVECPLCGRTDSHTHQF